LNIGIPTQAWNLAVSTTLQTKLANQFASQYLGSVLVQGNPMQSKFRPILCGIVPNHRADFGQLGIVTVSGES
jgi:hypothetical protein